MAQQDSKQFEKEYLKRTSAGAWEAFKPFSPPDTHTLADSVPLIRDFAVALTHLPPSASDLILDLGAGACWNADWLERLNLKTVAVDISHDMLALGRTRLPRPESARLVTGDLETLPFADGSFDKAYCLSAIHHVPNIRKSLGEIARVLKADGAVLFSEPGLGHADKPTSVAAMQDFGVLEQDIVSAEFLAQCTDAGFGHVALKPMSYVIPEISITREQWMAWQKMSRSKRPIRGLRRMWLGLLEVFGLAKNGPLLEDTFGMTLVRLLEGAMHDHPVVVARKSSGGRVGAESHMARIAITSSPAKVTRGQAIPMKVRVTNSGPTAWETAAVGTGLVRLGVQLLDADRRLVNRDFQRIDLGSAFAPNETRDINLVCGGIGDAGLFHLKCDVVVEGVAWLEPRGSTIAVAQINVS